MINESRVLLDLKSISETQDPISKIISLCYRREYEDAEKVMDDVYKQYKNHPSYWNQVGTCYYLRGDLRKALLYYKELTKFRDSLVSVETDEKVAEIDVKYQTEKKEKEILA